MTLSNAFIRTNVIGAIQAEVDKGINQEDFRAIENNAILTGSIGIFAFPVNVELNEKEKNMLVKIFGSRKSHTCKFMKVKDLVKPSVKDKELHSSLRDRLSNIKGVSDKTEIIFLTKRRF